MAISASANQIATSFKESQAKIYVDQQIKQPDKAVRQVGLGHDVSSEGNKQSSPKVSTPTPSPKPIDYRDMETSSRSCAPPLNYLTRSERNSIDKKTLGLAKINCVVIQRGASAVSQPTTPKTGTPKEKTPNRRSLTPTVGSNSSSASSSSEAPYVGYAVYTRRDEQKGDSTTEPQSLPSFALPSTSQTTLSLIKEEEETVNV